LRLRYCKTFGIDPRTADLTLADLIEFQAWQEYESANIGAKTLYQSTTFLNPIQNLENNYQMFIADLLLRLNYANGTVTSDYPYQGGELLYPNRTEISQDEIVEQKRKMLGVS